MPANRSATFSEYHGAGHQGERGVPVRRTESLPVNASTRKPNRVDVGVSTAGLRGFVKEGQLPPRFVSILQPQRKAASTKPVGLPRDPEKEIVESPSEISPVDNPTSFTFARPNGRREPHREAATDNAVSAMDYLLRAVAADSDAQRNKDAPLSKTSRHARRMSTPKPILRVPGRSLPDVGTVNISVHANDTIVEEEVSISQPYMENIGIEAADGSGGETNQTTAPVNELRSAELDDPSAILDSGPQLQDFSGVEVEYEDDSPAEEIEDAELESAMSRITDSVYAMGLADTLDLSIISHDPAAVRRMNDLDIAWGVQYELARGVCHGLWTWDEVTTERLELLRGSSFERVPLITDVMGKGPGTLEAFRQAERIYAEMDREQKARLENNGRGLGLCGAWEGVENWYGGRLQQIARLRKAPGSQSYTITLEKMQEGKSNRVTRFAGSRSILQIRMEQKLIQNAGDDLIKFLAKRQVICGRVFHPFSAKENKVYLVECNDDLDRVPKLSEGDHLRLSWEDFISWHNPLKLNQEQPISKWATRWALVLSTSKPVIEFDPENVKFIDDKYANGGGSGVEEIMTDGCGLMNFSALKAIATLMGLQQLPPVIQARLAGAKGLWLLHNEKEYHDPSQPPMIWIRKSQNKIKLPPLHEVHRSHRVLDLVRLPRLTVPSSINRQTITNLSSNGVPDAPIVHLLESGLLSEIEPLTKWTGPNARVLLGRAVENAEGVVGGRRGRLAGLEARAFTFIRDEKDVGEEEGDSRQNSALVDRYTGSGCPTSLSELARELLQAGFSPLNLPYLRDKIKKIIEKTTSKYVDQFRISVPNSAEAFIAPDPFGVLKEGEIYFRSSEPIGDGLALDPYTFSGSVLVMRNPTMVASDIQKVTVVYKNEFLPYKDVIFFPVKGHRSLASYLGGGDYDGDTVTILAEPSIVDSFKNPVDVQEPKDLRQNFEPEIERVSAFCDRVRNMSTAPQRRELSIKLLSGLSESKVGLYSRFHENVVYSLGYNHPEATRLAYMFTTCLDSIKSGLRLKGDVFNKDNRKYVSPQPPYVTQKEASQSNSGPSSSKAACRRRPPALGPFILDILQEAGRKLQADVLADYQKLCNDQEESIDNDLMIPYAQVRDLVEDPVNKTRYAFLAGELEALRAHVQDRLLDYKDALEAHDRNDREARSNGESRRSLVQRLINEFWSGLAKFQLTKAFLKPEEIMASYAYTYSVRCGEKRMLSTYAKDFPFAVAHTELCAIKARACGRGGMVSATLDYADFTLTHGPLVKMLVKTSD